ncbi:hypothetical protein KI387_012775, partial [Taxus chinensis]
GKDNIQLRESVDVEDKSTGIWRKPSEQRKTKIVCTIGPSTSTPEMIRKLAEAGMNVARMNMSHGDHASHKRFTGLVEEYNAQNADNVITIMLDTKQSRDGACDVDTLRDRRVICSIMWVIFAWGVEHNVELLSAKLAVDTTRKSNKISLSIMAVNRIKIGDLDELVYPHLAIHKNPEVKDMVSAVAELALSYLASDRDVKPDIKEVASKLEEINQLHKQI